MLEQAVSPDMPPLDRIEISMKTYVQYFVEHREMWDMLDVSYRRLSLPQELIQRFDAMLQTFSSYICTAVQDYLTKTGLTERYDSRELALLLIASVDGLYYDLKQGFFEDSIKRLSLERLVAGQIEIFKTFLTASAKER
jgi:hypothetical protein